LADRGFSGINADGGLLKGVPVPLFLLSHGQNALGCAGQSAFVLLK
jgi:hypothetical protein